MADERGKWLTSARTNITHTVCCKFWTCLTRTVEKKPAAVQETHITCCGVGGGDAGGDDCIIPRDGPPSVCDARTEGGCCCSGVMPAWMDAAGAVAAAGSAASCWKPAGAAGAAAATAAGSAAIAASQGLSVTRIADWSATGAGRPAVAASAGALPVAGPADSAADSLSRACWSRGVCSPGSPPRKRETVAARAVVTAAAGMAAGGRGGIRGNRLAESEAGNAAAGAAAIAAGAEHPLCSFGSGGGFADRSGGTDGGRLRCRSRGPQRAVLAALTSPGLAAAPGIPSAVYRLLQQRSVVTVVQPDRQVGVQEQSPYCLLQLPAAAASAAASRTRRILSNRAQACVGKTSA